MNLIEREGGANREYDTAHLLLDGDTVTGENIFSHQPHEIDLTLDEQIDLACKLYLEQIRRLSARFPSVQVVCQAGNHDRSNTVVLWANSDWYRIGFGGNGGYNSLSKLRCVSHLSGCCVTTRRAADNDVPNKGRIDFLSHLNRRGRTGREPRLSLVLFGEYE